MKRSQLGLLVVSLAALFGTPTLAHAKGSDIAKSLGNLRWGMSQNEVKAALKGKMKSPSSAEFDGSRTRWDSSPVAEEYTHGNEESMLTYASDDGSDNYYFFIGDELWKWVKLYRASTFGGSNYKNFASKVKARFGNGYEKSGEVNPGSGFSYKFIEFMDRDTRLRAVDKTEQQGNYALVFEAMGTVRDLASLRSSTIRRVTNKKAAMAKAEPSEDDEQEEDTPREAKSKDRNAKSSASRPTFTLASSKKKSLFGGDDQQQGETADQYQARKQKTIADDRARQQRSHEREEDAKKSKTLDELAGYDDDDPISGVK